MTQLSPAAQAVRDAVLATYADSIPKDDNLWALERSSTVAALRAVADEVEALPLSTDYIFWDSGQEVGIIRAVDKLLAIADELEDNA